MSKHVEELRLDIQRAREAGYRALMLPVSQVEIVLDELAQQLKEMNVMQMAAIGTAALGYWKEGDPIHPDYDTVALRDVAKLYAKYDALYKAQP